MSGVVEKTCPLLLCSVASEETPKVETLSKKLESKDEEEQIEGLKEVIHCIVSGMDMSRLTMQVIKFCLRSRNHRIKKLLSIFWEVLDKTYPTGKLKTEMILVCNHLLQDLKHANEYIRGSTCRLLCRIHEAEILEQLVPQVLVNLEHSHPYVRKNAVLALMSTFQLHPSLVPDAPVRVFEFIVGESNSLARRNAFLMLVNTDLRAALDFFLSVEDKLSTFPETMQISILELMRKVSRTMSVPKSLFVKSSASLLDSNNNSVVFEAATTLLALTPLDSAINRALSAYCRLLQTESDQNVKIVVVNRIDQLKSRYERNLRLCLMDLLRALSTPNLDVRRKILGLVLDLANSSNIEEVIKVLKKEIVNANAEVENTIGLSGGDAGVSGDQSVLTYRNLLVETIHHCAVKFPEVASSVVHILMNYLSDDNHQAALDVITFVKEIVTEYPDLQDAILDRLLESFNDIQSENVFRVALWILGEFASTTELIQQSINAMSTGLGSLPLYDPAENTVEEDIKEEKKEDDEPRYVTRTVVLDDGTYATETVAVTSGAAVADVKSEEAAQQCKLRSLIKSGEHYLCAVFASTLTKLVLRLRKNPSEGTTSKTINRITARCLLMLTSILRYGSMDSNKKPMDDDTKGRLNLAIHTLLQTPVMKPEIQQDIMLGTTKRAFGMLLSKKRSDEGIRRREDEMAKSKELELVPFDTLINIRQLQGNEFVGFGEDDALNVAKAAANKVLDENLRTRLSRVRQLTGFSDTIYAEACVTVHQFDIVLDFLIINNDQNDTLQNVSLELHTSGDLKLVDKPSKLMLAPGDVTRTQASIKVSSTENGMIFGNIVFDRTKRSGVSPGNKNEDNSPLSNIVVMNCIHMDIMDYVHPHGCDEEEFRNMWAEFEWENKVSVNTDIRNLHDYLKHIAKITNMQILTSSTFSRECQFLAANLHAKSIFGEHALMNASIELKEEKDQSTGVSKTRVVGHIRIRCKSQGIALSLGEKITNKQKTSA